MSNLATERAPRPWEIRASAADGSGGWLRIGHRAFALRDVTGVGGVARAEPNVDGHIVMICLFMVIGCAFLLAVMGKAAHPRFLAASALFVGVGLMAAGEVVWRRAATLYRLEVRLRDGTAAEFATADPTEYLALKAALEEHMRRLGPA